MTLLLALIIGVTGDGGVDGGAAVDFTAPLYGQCSEAPPVERVDGGVFMPAAREARVACLMVTCESDRQRKSRLLDEQPIPPAWYLWAVGLSAALALGAVIGRWWPW